MSTVRPRLAHAGKAAAIRIAIRGRLHGLRSGIVFTRVFEDHEVDRRALAIEPGDAVLVVASAGDKAIHAVLWGAERVVAADINPAQLHLLALKLAALRALDHASLRALFADGRSATARASYALLRPALDAPVATYWDRWIGIFETGLHRHNALGLAIAGVGWGLRKLGGRALLPTIMAVTDPAAQGRVYDARLRRRYWNPWTRWLLGRAALLRPIVLDPQERAAMGRERFAEWLEARVSHVVRTSLVRENPYWWPVLTGRAMAAEHDLPWLRPESLDALRSAGDRISLEPGSLVDVVARAEPASFQAVDLSNVPDWLPATERTRLWAGLARAVAPGGRILLRSAFRTPPGPPDDIDALVPDAGLSAELTAAERTAIYASVLVVRRPATTPEGTT